MLKLRKDNNIVLGVDKMNVERLKQGDPIRIIGSELSLDVDIYLVYGETLKEIAEELGLANQIN